MCDRFKLLDCALKQQVRVDKFDSLGNQSLEVDLEAEGTLAECELGSVGAVQTVDTVYADDAGLSTAVCCLSAHYCTGLLITEWWVACVKPCLGHCRASYVCQSSHYVCSLTVNIKLFHQRNSIRNISHSRIPLIQHSMVQHRYRK